MNGGDSIIHMAAHKAAGESMTDPEKYAMNNLTGTINLINAQQRQKLNTSSSLQAQLFTGSLNTCRWMKHTPLNPSIFMDIPNWEKENLLGWYRN
ncbi:MAG: hypothetical protein CM1200mP28_11040 [Deltaproteobacteria bacterium]|nr:MAG: hypothetical protein CM1200mP28_11040 [Deltaproteobacteria bacterium]